MKATHNKGTELCGKEVVEIVLKTFFFSFLACDLALYLQEFVTPGMLCERVLAFLSTATWKRLLEDWSQPGAVKPVTSSPIMSAAAGEDACESKKNLCKACREDPCVQGTQKSRVSLHCHGCEKVEHGLPHPQAGPLGVAQMCR